AVQESFVSKFGNSKFRRSLKSIRYVSEFITASIFAESSFRHQPQRGCGSKPKVGAHAPTLGERDKTGTTATRLWPTSHDGPNKWTEPRYGRKCLLNGDPG